MAKSRSEAPGFVRGMLGSPKEFAPTIGVFDPVAEHTIPHQALAMSLAATPTADPELEVMFGDNYTRLNVVNELARKTTIPIHLMTPTSDKAITDVTLYEAGQTAFTEAKQEGRITLPLYATEGSFVNFLRDSVILANVKGRKSLVIPGKNPIDYFTLVSLYARLAHDFGLATNTVPTWLEGGNIKTGSDCVFTLTNSMRRIQRLMPAGKSYQDAKRVMQKRVGKGDKTLVVLDEEFRHEERQRVFHLDVVASLVIDPNGVEKVIITSLTEAKRVLEATFGTNWLETMSEDEWVEACGTTWMAEIEGLIELHFRSLMTKFSFSKSKEQKVKEHLKKVYGFPKEALIAFQKSLNYYFGDNYDQVQPYIDNIIEGFIHAGYSESQIILVPGLITNSLDPTNQRTEMPTDGSNLISKAVHPIYTPSNGMQFNQGDQHHYITGGGISIFDRIATERISEQTGLDVVTLINVLPMGVSLSGFNCMALPIPSGSG